MIRAGIDAERLRGILDCMHAEADERDKHSEQIREIVKTAKEAGYDTKAVRKVFVRERMDDADRRAQDDLLETYEAALGGKGRALAAIAAGIPSGEAAKANGVHRSTIARARSVAKQTSIATTPHDADGVIIEDAAPDKPPSPAPEFGVGAGTEYDVPIIGPAAHWPVRVVEEQAQPLSEGGDGIGHQYLDVVPPNIAAAVVRYDAATGDITQAIEPATPSVGAVAEPSAAQRVATPEPDLTIPFFLRRVA